MNRKIETVCAECVLSSLDVSFLVYFIIYDRETFVKSKGQEHSLFQGWWVGG